MALSHSLKALVIGSAASCLKFGKALEEQGVLSLECLNKLPVGNSLQGLERVKMTDIQFDAVIEAMMPPPAIAAVSTAPSPALTITHAKVVPRNVRLPPLLRHFGFRVVVPYFFQE